MTATGWAATPNEVLQDPSLPATAKAVFAVLASYADEEGRAWPAVKTLAAALGMSTNTVERHLQHLRDYGLVQWEVRSTPRGRQRFYGVWKPGAPKPMRVPSSAEGSPHQEGGVYPNEGVGVYPSEGQEQEPENQEPLEQLPAADAPDALISIEDAGGTPVAATPLPTGRDLFKAWVDGYTEAHGVKPDPSVNGQLSGRVREVVKTRDGMESWRAAWRAFKAAGAAGSLYVARYMLDPTVTRTPVAQNAPTPAITQAQHDAWRRERDAELAALEAQYAENSKPYVWGAQ